MATTTNGVTYDDSMYNTSALGMVSVPENATMEMLESYYLSSSAVKNQKKNIKELIEFIKKRDPNSLNEIEKWVVTHLEYEYDKEHPEDEIAPYDSQKLWRQKMRTLLSNIGRVDFQEAEIKFILTHNVKILSYIISLMLDDASIGIERLSNHIPMSIETTQMKVQGNAFYKKGMQYYFNDKINSLNKESESLFYESDLNVKDKSGKKVEADKIANEERRSPQGETNAIFISRQVVRALVPSVDVGIYAIKTGLGFDVYGKLSGNKFMIDKGERDTWLNTNFDKNIFVNTVPDILMSISKRTNNKMFRYAAASSPLIMQLITNWKERGNPFKMNDEEDTINWTQIISLGIPLFVEIFQQLFPMQSFQNLLGSKEIPAFNKANEIWSGIESNNNQHQYNGNYYDNNRNYYQVRREIKQPIA